MPEDFNHRPTEAVSRQKEAVLTVQHQITAPQNVSARKHVYIVTNAITLRYVIVNKQTVGSRR